MRKAFKDVMSLFLGNLGSILISLPIVILLARLLGPSGFGILSLLLSLRDIFCVITSLGLGRAALYFLAKEKERRENFGSIFLMRFFLSLVGATLFFSLSPLFEAYYRIDRFSLYARILSLDIILYGLFLLSLSSLNGLSKFKESAVMNIVYNFLRVSSVVFVLMGTGLMGAIGGYLFSSFTALLLCSYFLSDVFTFILDKVKVKKILEYSVPSYSIDVSYMIMNSVPLTILGLFGSVVVGYFSAASKVVGVLSLFLNAIVSVGVQRTSSRTDIEGQKEIAKRVTKYSTYAISLFAFMVIPFSSQIIRIVFSESFAPATVPLVFLATTLLFRSLSAGPMCYLLGVGKPRIVTKILLISALLTVILSLLLIPVDPLFGISLTFLIVFCIYSLMFSFSVRFIDYKVIFLRSVLAGGTTIILTKLVVLLLPTVPAIILGGLSGVAVFLTLLYLLDGFDEYDMRLFYDLFEALKRHSLDLKGKI